MIEELASKKFSDLSKAELELLRAAPHGLLAHCGDPAEGSERPVNNSKHVDIWTKEQEIRCDLVRLSCQKFICGHPSKGDLIPISV